MIKLKKVMLVSIVLVLAISFVGCNNQNIIAEYSGGEVTEAEFNIYLGVIQFFNPQYTEITKDQEAKKKILEEFIGEKYLSEQVEVNKTVEDNAGKMFELIKEQKIKSVGSEAEYDKSLTGLEITEEEILNYLIRFYSIQTYFIEKKYNENKDEFTIATVSHILIGTEGRTEAEAKVRAKEVLAKLKQGEDFAALAKEYSDDPGSKNNGGTYENAAVALWVPEFKEAALTLPVNEISDLVKTVFGFHIIKVNDRKIPDIDEIPDDQKTSIMAEGYSQFMMNDLQSIIDKINLTEE